MTDKERSSLFKVPVYVSEADLKEEQVAKVVERLGLDIVLRELFGFDTLEVVCDVEPFFYEVMECEHRQRLHPHQIVKGKRYLGYERLDKAWINGVMASEEAKMSAKNDKDYLSELKKLGG